MKLLEFKNRLESIQGLPTLPLVMEHLGNELRDRDADAGRIAGIIENDPAIMARIMKVVNSSFYLGEQPVTSLKAAIVRLGFQAVGNIAMAVAVFSTFPPGMRTGFDRTAFWRHCIFTGVAADRISGSLPRYAHLDIGRDVFHLCGLLHDIGKIIFEQYFHEQFARAIQISKTEQIPLHEAEVQVLGVDHAQAGAWLGRKWKLPEQVVEVIRWHHKPLNAMAGYTDLVAVCHMADMAVNMSESESGGNRFPAGEQLSNPDRAELERIQALVGDASESSSLMMSFLM